MNKNKIAQWCVVILLAIVTTAGNVARAEDVNVTSQASDGSFEIQTDVPADAQTETSAPAAAVMPPPAAPAVVAPQAPAAPVSAAQSDTTPAVTPVSSVTPAAAPATANATVEPVAVPEAAPSVVPPSDAAAEKETTERNVDVRANGLRVEPLLSVRLANGEHSAVRGEAAHFEAYSNYPTYVEHGEIRIFAGDADVAPLAVVAADKDGAASWTLPSDAPGELHYVYRVYDQEGHFDETTPKTLTVVDARAVQSNTEPAQAKSEFDATDEAHVRNIPLSKTAAIVVEGHADPKTESVTVGGQPAKIGSDGKFVAQQLVDKKTKNVRVKVARNGKTQFEATRDINVPRSDWFYVVQGDLTFISSKAKGPAVVVSGDPLADGDHVTGRAAAYVKGAFGDDWKLTASVDTGEALIQDLFSNLDRKDPRQVLRRLNSNEYYPTYGDDSTVVEDAPTQSRFYLHVQGKEDSLLVGNFIANLNQAELAQLDRGLFGAIVQHKSEETTSFGERKLEVTAFASDPGTIPGRDEFRGTGGSLYYLKRQDISVGSERLRVEIRDRDTGLVLQTRELRPQEDYDIDYLQGRLTLLKPLPSFVSTGDTVRDGSGNGNVPVLVARYEYTPAVGDLSGYTLGGRAQMWLDEHVRLGATAQKETTAEADQILLGADAEFRLHAGTYLKAEFAQTSGPAFGQSNSVDGGLTFKDIASPASIDQHANAYRVETAVDLAELKLAEQGRIAAFYERFDAGFAANAHLTQSDTQRWGASASLTTFKDTNVALKYEELHSNDAGTHRAANADVTQKLGGDFEAKFGLKHDLQVPGLLFNSTEKGKRTDAGLQLAYKPAGRSWSVYGFGQVTLDRDGTRRGNSRLGVGGKADLTDALSLDAEVSAGEGGLGADTHLNYRYAEGSEAYIGYSLLADRGLTGLEPSNLFTRTNKGQLTFGTKHRFSSSFSAYSENGVGFGDQPTKNWRVGGKYDPSEHLSFSGSFEDNLVDDPTTGAFKRRAATIGVGYTTKALQIGSSIEGRIEKGQGRDQKMLLVRNSATLQLDPSWRALGRFNFAVSNDDAQSVRAADYVEGVAGFAYRPVTNDRLNILARYAYFRDMGPIGQVTSGGEKGSPKQISQIISIDANYDLTPAFTIGAKYGYRQGKVSLGRDSKVFVSSNTHLGILRADWRPVREWDVVAEGRYLTNDIGGNSRTGALVAVYRHINDNVKIGVGYSFSDFSDDLSDQSYTSRGVFVNLVTKF